MSAVPPYDLSCIPAGSTVILSTTSPDKKLEYSDIFARFDVNFFTLEDFGLAPQKTDEMTGSYENNLLQKGVELAKTLAVHFDSIKARLKLRGIDSPMIVSMAEDSGIEIYPADRALREPFKIRFHDLLWDRILADFHNNPALRHLAFGPLSDEEISLKIDSLLDNISWLFEIDHSSRLPGPNFKPIMEHLHGGFVEIFALMYQALEDILQEGQKTRVQTERLLRYRNHCSSLLVAPALDIPAGGRIVLDSESIVYGDNKGFIVSRNEFARSIAIRAEARNYPVPAKYQTGEIYTSHLIIPDGQPDPATATDRQTLIEEYGLLHSNHHELAQDYRLKLAQELAARHGLPLAMQPLKSTKELIREDLPKPQRWRNPAPLRVMLLYPGQQPPPLLAKLEERLREIDGLKLVPMPDMATLQADPAARVMQGADVACLLPDSANGVDVLWHARLVMAATVDKQVMPSAKEKCLIMFNLLDTQAHPPYRGAYEPTLGILRHTQLSGLKNGLSEIDHVLEMPHPRLNSQLNDGTEQTEAAQLRESVEMDALMLRLLPLIRRQQARKAHRLTEVEGIKPPQEKADLTLTPIPDHVPTVFVAGGAANDYPLFIQAANLLGRFLYQKGWVLVTGAGQRDGPMGAVHSGFVEAYLEHRLSPWRQPPQSAENLAGPIDRNAVEEVIDKLIAGILAERRLLGKEAEQSRKRLRKAILDQPDAYFLGVHAPSLLEKILDPRPNSVLATHLGSLLQSRQMVGYSMPPLLISEGTGQPPPGMHYQNAGNMQRRMLEMTKAQLHVYVAGGQGTQQELIESLLISVERCRSGQPPLPIFLIDHPSYRGGTVFQESLSLIEHILRPHYDADTPLEAMGIHRCDSVHSLCERLASLNLNV